MEKEVVRVVRRLADGWDYRPDWRATVVQALLKGHPKSNAEKICAGETDPYIRQYIRFLRGGRCLEQGSFAYAHRLHDGRKGNGGAGILKAMTIAAFSPKEIAQQLGTTSKNVALYQLLFFDIGQYLDNRAWLASIAIPPNGKLTHDPIEIRERMLLAAAYHRGQAGLMRVLTNSVPTSDHEIEEMHAAIRGAIVAKAYSFAMASLQTGPSPDDLARYIEMMRLPVSADTTKAQARFEAFGAQLRSLVMGKVEEEAAKEGVAGSDPLQESSTNNPAFSRS